LLSIDAYDVRVWPLNLTFILINRLLLDIEVAISSIESYKELQMIYLYGIELR
jgi:hypothetical protein